MCRDLLFKVAESSWTTQSPLFFRKIVEIERFALRAAILDAMSVKST